MPKSNYVHFRLDPQVEAMLDAEVARLKGRGFPPSLANRSIVMRTILTNALEGDGVDSLTVDAGLELLMAGVQRAVAQLPALVEDEMRAISAERIATAEAVQSGQQLSRDRQRAVNRAARETLASQAPDVPAGVGG